MDLMEAENAHVSSDFVTNGMVIDHFKEYGKAATASWLQLQDPKTNMPQYNTYISSVSRLVIHYRNLNKSKKRAEGALKLTSFLEEPYKFPEVSTNPGVKSSSIASASQFYIEAYQEVTASLASEVQKISADKSAQKEEMERKIQAKVMEVEKLSKDIDKKTAEEEHLKYSVEMKRKQLKRVRESENYWRAKSSRLEKQQQPEPMEIVKTLKQKLTDSLVQADELQFQVDNLKEEVAYIYNEEEGKYTAELQLCVYTLLELNVGSQNVGGVIEACLKLVGKKPNRVPCPLTVNNINIQRVWLSQKQLSEDYADKEETTLHTDETSKYGDKYGAFAARDKEGIYYCLGLREMPTKSAQDTLDTFQMVLQDIKQRSQETECDIGKKILCHIANTMSDKAATECKFNQLLEMYRKEVLPEIKEGYSQLLEDDRIATDNLTNFFCGLHSLVHMAETARNVFVELEKSNPSLPDTPKECRQGNEPAALHLVRIACKAFARGADEKSGCHRPFTTYLKLNNFLKENHLLSVPLVPYRGYRFNILFANAGHVYFLHQQMISFLETQVRNKLQEYVLQSLKNEFFVAGTRALGLVSKYVTTPLWKLLEDKSIHVLDMNGYYLDLLTFLKDAATNIDDFMAGKNTPFENVAIREDNIHQCLVTSNQYDSETKMILGALLPALAKLVEKEFEDQLPGGKFEHPTPSLRSKLDSMEKHNKFVERLFGYMDQLLRFKPNVQVLAAEAYTMFSANKTKHWLAAKDPETARKLVNNARRSVKDLRELYKIRKQGDREAKEGESE